MPPKTTTNTTQRRKLATKKSGAAATESKAATAPAAAAPAHGSAAAASGPSKKQAATHKKAGGSKSTPKTPRRAVTKLANISSVPASPSKSGAAATAAEDARAGHAKATSATAPSSQLPGTPPALRSRANTVQMVDVSIHSLQERDENGGAATPATPATPKQRQSKSVVPETPPSPSPPPPDRGTRAYPGGASQSPLPPFRRPSEVDSDAELASFSDREEDAVLCASEALRRESAGARASSASDDPTGGHSPITDQKLLTLLESSHQELDPCVLLESAPDSEADADADAHARTTPRRRRSSLRAVSSVGELELGLPDAEPEPRQPREVKQPGAAASAAAATSPSGPTPKPRKGTASGSRGGSGSTPRVYSSKQPLLPEITAAEQERTVTVVFDLDETLCNNRFRNAPALLRPGALAVLRWLRAQFVSPQYKPLRRSVGRKTAGERLYASALKSGGMGYLLEPPPPSMEQRHAAAGGGGGSDEAVPSGAAPSSATERQQLLEELGSAGTSPSRSSEPLRLELILWTASQENVARPVVKRLDPHDTIFDFCIYRDMRWYSTYTSYVKDLQRLGRAMDRVVIVENAPSSVRLNRPNAILVHDFVSNKHDVELYVVRTVLKHWITRVNGHLKLRARREGQEAEQRAQSGHDSAGGGALDLTAEGDAAPDFARRTYPEPAHTARERSPGGGHHSHPPLEALSAFPLPSHLDIVHFLHDHQCLVETNYVRLAAVKDMAAQMHGTALDGVGAAAAGDGTADSSGSAARDARGPEREPSFPSTPRLTGGGGVIGTVRRHPSSPNPRQSTKSPSLNSNGNNQHATSGDTFPGAGGVTEEPRKTTAARTTKTPHKTFKSVPKHIARGT